MFQEIVWAYLIISPKISIHKPGWAEGYDIIRPCTSKNTSWIIISIAIRSRARLLKLLGIKRRLASRRVSIIPFAAILISVKHITCTTTPNGLAVSPKGKFLGATVSKVRITSSGAAVSLSVYGLNGHRHIEAVDEAHVVEVRLR